MTDSVNSKEEFIAAWPTPSIPDSRREQWGLVGSGGGFTCVVGSHWGGVAPCSVNGYVGCWDVIGVVHYLLRYMTRRCKYIPLRGCLRGVGWRVAGVVQGGEGW